jgi:hypothetical protein
MFFEKLLPKVAWGEERMLLVEETILETYPRTYIYISLSVIPGAIVETKSKLDWRGAINHQ